MLEKNVKTLGGNLAKCTTDLNIKLHCYKRKLEKKNAETLTHNENGKRMLENDIGKQ